MNELERLLALEAALTACEGIGGGALQLPLSQLQTAVENELTKHNVPADFDKYSEFLHSSVLRLALNPQVFGGEPLDTTMPSDLLLEALKEEGHPCLLG